MSELRQILDLWKRAGAAGEEICLATVVGIEGSAYRRPGARMLLTSSGLRAGTISGGCLEAEVVKKAWWLTTQGPALQRYSSFFDDDGDMPYGLGCGGTVIVLLEQGEAAGASLEALRRSVEERTPSVIVTQTAAKHPGTVLVLNHAGEAVFGADEDLSRAAEEVLRTRTSARMGEAFIEYVAPPLGLFVFGAGDDAQPLVEFAAALGWHVAVADGRANLARAERFPWAARVQALDESLAEEVEDAAVIMTHSYEQDRRLLRMLLPLKRRYLGILGPKQRTERLVGEVAPELGLDPADCLTRLHSPVGLDIGGHSPATIALSIVAEIQAELSGHPMRRAAAEAVHA